MKYILFHFAIFLFVYSNAQIQPTLMPTKIKAIDSMLIEMTQKGFSGSVLISEKDMVLLNKGYGYASKVDRRINDENTLFEIASITKLYTVAAILQLAQKGRLDLNDKLGKYLGVFNSPKDSATIHHLLAHTAGLVPRGHSLDYNSRIGFVKSVKDAPLESIPGEKYRYTNAGYTLLAAIIEEASGISYPKYLKKYIFSKLKLKDTFFERKNSSKNYANGYKGKSIDSLEVLVTPPYVWGDRGPSGIVTNTLDLHRFLMGLQNHELLRQEYQDLMFNEQIEGEAYGFHILDQPNIGKTLTRGGGLPHFESQVVWYLEENIKVLFFINNRLKLRKPVWDKIESIIFNSK